jgi:uncharacterized protein
VIHKKNSIDEAFKFFKEEFKMTPSISEISSQNIDDKKINEFKAISNVIGSNLNTYLENNAEVENPTLFETVNQDAFKFFRVYDGNTFANYSHLFFKESITFLPTGTCLPFSKKIYLTSKGKVLPCERIGDLFDFGYVTDKSVNLDFNKIANTYNSFYKNLKSHCLLCDRITYCSICLFHIKDVATSPKCEFHLIKKGDDFDYYLNN